MFRGELPRVTLASLRGNGLSLQLFRGQVTSFLWLMKYFCLLVSSLVVLEQKKVAKWKSASFVYFMWRIHFLS